MRRPLKWKDRRALVNAEMEKRPMLPVAQL